MMAFVLILLLAAGFFFCWRAGKNWGVMAFIWFVLIGATADLFAGTLAFFLVGLWWEWDEYAGKKKLDDWDSERRRQESAESLRQYSVRRAAETEREEREEREFCARAEGEKAKFLEDEWSRT